jgi:DNA-binding NarL/FixJ family response regulator
MTRRLRVLTVDDAPDLAEYIRRLMRREPDMECVGTLECADELVEHAQRLSADVVLLDLSMPGVDPLSIFAELLECGDCRVMVMSGYDDRETIERVRSLGASGFVSKDADPLEIIAGVRAVGAGQTYFADSGPGGSGRRNGVL